MSIYGVTDTPVSDFWWCLLWVSKPEWPVLFTLSGALRVPRSTFTFGATPLPVCVASIVPGCFLHMQFHKCLVTLDYCSIKGPQGTE